jgi:hypothetical protein
MVVMATSGKSCLTTCIISHNRFQYNEQNRFRPAVFEWKTLASKGTEMKPGTTGTLSGCLVWVLVFFVVSSCFLPVAMFVGGFSSGSTPAMKLLGPILCPAGTTAESYSYQTTTTDDFGNPEPATATELHCMDAGGNVVKTDVVGFAFLWEGIVAVISLVAAAGLAFVFAAPAGVLIARLTARLRAPKA